VVVAGEVGVAVVGGEGEEEAVGVEEGSVDTTKALLTQ
jgi:hypothetical protein